ncbi:MAG: DNA polymerase III subunit gamma/tau [Phycisphaerae bacterium]|nr:DNA polymerase III subunit gamma/tau [Phycisphaerae bacterium]
MAYTVLARKYRSRNFDEVVGQDPIATTLKNAIAAGRIHHGYLFTGTRGVGKTSLARILAKALNCLASDGPTGSPCLKCDSCNAIAEGQDLDVIEIDAASNTGVDNIRELRGNAAYRPARARFKIYIIDEVHMLSTGAFNALLKTLEEPPAHVKFILATTEIQKVPATIQSRCQRFTFRNIDAPAIAGALQRVCASEGIPAEEPALARIARLANGSMRDALSILDQVLSISPKKLSLAVLEQMLPPARHDQLLHLLNSAAAADAGATLAATDAILNGGQSLEVFCSELVEVLRNLLLLRAGVAADQIELPSDARAEFEALAAKFELSHYVQMIAVVEELRRNVRFSGSGRALIDAAMVRFAKLREWSSIEQIIAGLGGGGSAAGGSLEKKKSAEISGVAATTPAAKLPAAPRPTGAAPAHSEQAPRSSSRRESAAPAAPAQGEAATASAARRPVGDSAPRRATTERPPEPQPALKRGLRTDERAALEGDPLVNKLMREFDAVYVRLETTAPDHRSPARAAAADEPFESVPRETYIPPDHEDSIDAEAGSSDPE